MNYLNKILYLKKEGQHKNPLFYKFLCLWTLALLLLIPSSPLTGQEKLSSFSQTTSNKDNQNLPLKFERNSNQPQPRPNSNCEQIIDPGNEFVDGIGQFHLLTLANDLVVEENEIFSLNSLDFNVAIDPNTTINEVIISFYEDTGNGPGERIGLLPSLTPSSIEHLGYIYQLEQKRVNVELDAPFSLIGGSNDVVYWVGVTIEYSGQNSFMQVTDLNTPNEIYYLSNHYGWLPGSDPGMFGIEYDGVISFYGECEDLEVCSGTPLAGEINGSGEFGVCPNQGFSLSATGYTQASGLIYQWQQKQPNTEEWMDIAGANSFILNITNGINEATDYRFRVECQTSGMSAVTNPVSAIILCYCIPNSACTMGYSINNVSLEGESQTIDNDSGCSTDGYGDFTMLNPADLISGEGYVLSVMTNHPRAFESEVRVWIDYDLNGNFENEELIATTNGNGLPTSGVKNFNITIPEEIDPGSYRMRVRLGFTSGTGFTGCSSFHSGETEDYMVQIIDPDIDCQGTPNAGSIDDDDISLCADSEFNLIATGASAASNGLERIWQKSNDGSNWTDLDGAYSSTYTIVEGINEATFFRYKVLCTNSGISETSNTLEVNLNSPTDCYCTPISICDLEQKITNVTLEGETTTINNDSDCINYGYSDFTHLPPADLYPTESYTISIGTDYEFTYLQELKAWIDFDESGSFEPSEEVFSSDGNGLDVGQTTFTFTIPQDIDPGLYRLRIRLNYAGVSGMNFDACSLLQNSGEAEDYIIEVLEIQDCQGSPSAGVIQDDFSVCPENSFTIKVENASMPARNLERTWQFSQDGQSNWTDIEGATASEYEVHEGIQETTYYRYTATCTTSGQTDTSDILEVMFNPLDRCPCEPSSNCSSPNNIQINNVTLEGESITINNDTECSNSGTPGYGDYTSLPAPDLEHNQLYTLSVSTGFHSPSLLNLRAWIDYNKNGEFEVSELIGATGENGMDESGTQSFEFQIPGHVNQEEYRVRVRLVYDPTGSELDSCSEYSHGETEDYLIEVKTTIAQPCEQPENLTVSEITDSSARISWLPVGDENQWQVAYGPEGYDDPVNEAEIVLVNGSPTIVLSGLETDTAYDIYVRALCDGEDLMSDWTGPANFTTQTLSVGDNSFQGFVIYPNPTDHFLIIESVVEIKSIGAFNPIGQQVISEVGLENGRLDVSKLSQGVYFLNVQLVDGSRGIFTFIKE